MRIIGILAATASIALAGCAANQQSVEDPLMWGRIDCSRPANEAELLMDIERVKAICLPRAEAASIAGTSAMPVGYGVGGAIASGISRGITSNQISTATIQSCMGEQGYVSKRRSEYDAYCATIAPPVVAPPPTRAGKRAPPPRAPRPAASSAPMIAPAAVSNSPATAPARLDQVRCSTDRDSPDSCEHKS